MSSTLLRAAVPAAAALLFGTAAIAAPSIAGDAFELSISYGGSLAGDPPITVGPFAGAASGTPGSGFMFDASNADLVGNFADGFASLTVHARWIDADSVHIWFGGDAIDFDNLVFTLSGLDFKSGLAPAPIVGASFDRNGGGPNAFSGFNEVQNGTVSEPTIGFGPSSVAMSFSYFSGALTGDRPTMQVDVLAQAVPEPQTYLLLLGGLGVLALARRRRARA
jgi:PEP-CTERM motif